MLKTVLAALVFLFSLCRLPAGSGLVQAQTIVAHRGASHEAPENTLAAFQLAWRQGADAIEGDFYLTRDGEIACIHDKTTARVAPGQPPLSVATSTFQELRGLDVGRWKDPKYAGEKVPTLQEVLATVPEGKQIFVEVKCGPEILPTLQTQLEASKLKPEQIVIICFDEEVVRDARQRMPHYKANWLTSYKQTKETRAWHPTRQDVLRSLARTAATGLGTNGNLDVIDQPFVAAVREAGFEFHVWTVNSAEAARAWQKMGAQSITTDRPAYIRRALGPGAASDRK